MAEDMKIRNKAQATIDAYTYHVGRFAEFFGKPLETATPEDVRSFQLHLLEERKVGWSSFNQAVCGLRFLYSNTLPKPWPVTMIPFGKRPRRLPTVLGVEEVDALLQCTPNALTIPIEMDLPQSLGFGPVAGFFGQWDAVFGYEASFLFPARPQASSSIASQWTPTCCSGRRAEVVHLLQRQHESNQPPAGRERNPHAVAGPFPGRQKTVRTVPPNQKQAREQRGTGTENATPSESIVIPLPPACQGIGANVHCCAQPPPQRWENGEKREGRRSAATR